MKRRIGSFVALFVGFFATSKDVPAQAMRLPQLAENVVNERLRVTAFQAFRLDATLRDGRLTLVAPFQDDAFALDLPRRSVRSDDYRLVTRRNGVESAVAPPPSSTYRGEAFAERSSGVRWRAAATWIDGQLRAYLHSEIGEIRVIQPLSDVIQGADPTVHVTFRDRDVLPHDGVCLALSTAIANAKKPSSNHGDTTPGWLEATAAAAFKLAEVALEGDVSYYASVGNSTMNAQNDIDTLMNAIASIYEAEVGITYEISELLLQTDGSEQYASSNSEVLLEQFRAFWNSNKGGVQRDTVHLLTGKNLTGSTIGIAYVGVICNKPFGYGLSQTTFSANLLDRVSLTSHEIGHNWNADHCDSQGDCGIMCSFINNCSGNYQLFGNSEENEIENFRDDVGCLGTATPATVAPLVESFEGSALDGDLWNTSKGAVVSSKAIGETSGKKAAVVDVGDKLVSKAIDPTEMTDPELVFFFAHRGVESSETLAVDFKDANGDWIPLTTVTSDGSTMSTFAPVNAAFTVAMNHDALKFRFKPDANQSNDDWYIDDFEIREAVAVPDARLDEANAVATLRCLPADQSTDTITLDVSNGGTGLAAANYTATEVVDRAWLALSNASGTVTATSEIDVVTADIDPTTVAIGTIEHARVRVTQTNGGPNDYYESVVTLVRAPGVCFAPGDTIGGEIAVPDETDTGYAYFFAGTTVSFTATTIDGALKPTITIKDSIGNTIDALEYGKNDEGETQSALIPVSGIYTFEITGRSSTIGAYAFQTARELPVEARTQVLSLVPAIAGSDVVATFTAGHGTALHLTAAASNDGFGPFTVSIVDPDGVTLNTALFTTALSDGGVLIRGLPLINQGEYTVTVSGFVGSETLRLTIDPQPPALSDSLVSFD